MNPEVKEKWLTALKSGNYKHGKERLRNIDNTYCCLGVLCDVYLQETGEGIWEIENIRGHYSFVTKMGPRNGILPEEVRLWAELDSNNPSKNGYTLAHINDTKTTTDYSPVIKAIEKSF